MTLKEKIAVMQACEDGKMIDIDVGRKGMWQSFVKENEIDPVPYFNWEDNNYRVHQEPEKKEVEFNRYELHEEEGILRVELMSKHGMSNPSINHVMSQSSFRNGYFELNDGTKSKVPYLFKHKIAGCREVSMSIIADKEDWESIYPVAVWLEE